MRSKKFFTVMKLYSLPPSFPLLTLVQLAVAVRKTGASSPVAGAGVTVSAAVVDGSARIKEAVGVGVLSHACIASMETVET